MSKHHRCKDCTHRPRPRSTVLMAAKDKTHGEQAKKAPCACACHRG